MHPPHLRRSRWITAATCGLPTALLLGLTGCNGCSSSHAANQPAAIVDGGPPPNNNAYADTGGQDPALRNLAAAATSSGPAKVLGASEQFTPQSSGESYPEGQQAPAPIVQGYSNQQAAYDAAAAGEQAIADADQPPPPLPQYDQPPAPGDGYLWTPGYWSYEDAGYFWVPGAWVAPPFYGALWTPPYWGLYGSSYHFYPGYWGSHVGYYGGIDYGFGYIGFGYFGGYWRGHDFFYNREVNHLGPGVHSFYNRPVAFNGRTYGMQPSSRVSFNGGRAGVNVSPRPSELAALHEAHYGATASQRQDRAQAAGNRNQFIAANHGAPAQAAQSHALGEAAHTAERPTGIQTNQNAASAAGHGSQSRSATVQQRQDLNQQRQNMEQGRAAALQNRGTAAANRSGAVQQRGAMNQQRNETNPTGNDAQRSDMQGERQNMEIQRNNQMQQQQRTMEQQRSAASASHPAPAPTSHPAPGGHGPR